MSNQSSNLYGYTSNNPISFVDPLGLYFRFEAVNGATDFDVMLARSQFATLYQLAQKYPDTAAGKELGKVIDRLAASDVTVTIKVNPKGTHEPHGFGNATTSCSDGTQSEIDFYPYNENKFAHADTSPPVVLLGHELRHAYEAAMGLRDDKNYEKGTIPFENGLRGLYGLDARPQEGTDPVSPNPFPRLPE